jgi:hypothetical protein
MVICVVALVVLSIMSLFSAKYRKPAKDAFKCVFKMIQFKPCDVGLETQIKTTITSKLMFAPSIARFFYKHFRVISWAFTIAFFVSLFYSAWGIYNIIVYGSCEPSNPGACLVTSQSAQTQFINQILGFLSCNEIPIVVIFIGIVGVSLGYFLIKKKGNNHAGNQAEK